MGDTVANSRLFDIYVEAQAGTLNHEDFFTAFHKADFNESTEFMAELAQTNNVNHASGAPTILEAYAVKWSDKNVPKTEKINALVECLFKTSNLQCHLQAPSSYFNNFLKFVDCYDLLKDMHDDFQKNQKSDKISRDQKNFFYGEFPVEPTVAFRYPWLHLSRMEKSDEASTALRDNLDHVLRYVFKDDGVMNDYLVKNILNIGSKETIECLLEKVDPNDRNGRLLYWNITSPTDYQVNTKEVNKNTTSVLLTRLDPVQVVSSRFFDLSVEERYNLLEAMLAVTDETSRPKLLDLYHRDIFRVSGDRKKLPQKKIIEECVKSLPFLSTFLAQEQLLGAANQADKAPETKKQKL